MATEEEIDTVFEKTDRLLSAGLFHECDEYLAELVHSDDLDILLSGLTSTWAAWRELVHRDALIGRIRSIDDRPGLVDGLIPERPDDIKDEAELKQALERLDEIWSAEDGTPEFEERSRLVVRIGVYEDQNYYIPEPDGEIAYRFRMEQEGKDSLTNQPA